MAFLSRELVRRYLSSRHLPSKLSAGGGNNMTPYPTDDSRRRMIFCVTASTAAPSLPVCAGAVALVVGGSHDGIG